MEKARKATPQRTGWGAGAGKGEKSHAPKSGAGHRSKERRYMPHRIGKVLLKGVGGT